MKLLTNNKESCLELWKKRQPVVTWSKAVQLLPSCSSPKVCTKATQDTYLQHNANLARWQSIVASYVERGRPYTTSLITAQSLCCQCYNVQHDLNCPVRSLYIPRGGVG